MRLTDDDLVAEERAGDELDGRPYRLSRRWPAPPPTDTADYESWKQPPTPAEQAWIDAGDNRRYSYSWRLKQYVLEPGQPDWRYRPLSEFTETGQPGS